MTLKKADEKNLCNTEGPEQRDTEEDGAQVIFRKIKLAISRCSDSSVGDKF